MLQSLGVDEGASASFPGSGRFSCRRWQSQLIPEILLCWWSEKGTAWRVGAATPLTFQLWPPWGQADGLCWVMPNCVLRPRTGHGFFPVPQPKARGHVHITRMVIPIALWWFGSVGVLGFLWDTPPLERPGLQSVWSRRWAQQPLLQRSIFRESI